MNSIGKRIEFFRKKQGLKQQELAKKLNLKSDSTVSSWELDLSYPKANMLLELCKVLDITISELFGVKKDEENSTDEIQTIKKALNEEGQKRLLDYAELLLLKYKK